MTTARLLAARIATCLVGVYAAWLAKEPAFADELDVPSSVKAAFDIGWKQPKEALAKAQEHLDSAAEQAPNDPRVPFARALILVHHHREQDASAALDLALANGKPLIPIRRVRIHLAVLIKDEATAKREMAALGKILAGASAEPRNLDAAEFLGKAAGFLTDMTERSGKGGEYTGFEDLEAGLKDELAKAYKKGQESLAKVAAEFDAKLPEERERALKEAIAEKERRQAEGAEQVKAAQSDAMRAAQAIAAFHAQFGAQYAVAAQTVQAGPRDIAMLEQQIAFIVSQPPPAPVPPGNDKGGKNKTPPLDPVLVMNQRRVTVQQLNGQIANVKTGVNRAANFIKLCDGNLAKLTVVSNNAANHLKKMEKAKQAVDQIRPDDDDAITSSLANKRKSFSTYSPLSLEAERDGILATYGVKLGAKLPAKAPARG